MCYLLYSPRIPQTAGAPDPVMWLVYDFLFLVLLLLAAPVLWARRGSHYLPTLRGRLGGHEGRVVRDALWIHAVSVGEVAVATTLVQALPEDVPVLVTTVTPTGQAQAKKRLHPRAAVAYLPFDLGFAVRRFFRRFRPRALVLVEGDYWPRILREARTRELPIAVVNGRVGDRSFARMDRWPVPSRLLGLLFRPVDRFGMQSRRDRERLIALGVPPDRIAVTGNLKYESPEPKRNPVLAARLRELAGDRPILVAGSTMDGEETHVLDAFEAAGGGKSALLVLAPRHPERWEEVDRLLHRREIPSLRRSRLESADPSKRPAVVLLDSLGELAGVYALAASAFIGGTLVPTGGHNPLEPALFGVPIVVGPSMENFRDMARTFDDRGAWARVASAEELGKTWRRRLDDPDLAANVGSRAQALLEENRGALGKTLDLLEPMLDDVFPT